MLDAGCWMEPFDFTQDKLLDVRNFFIAEAYKDFSLLRTAPRWMVAEINRVVSATKGYVNRKISKTKNINV